jgi:hypothetical protein
VSTGIKERTEVNIENRTTLRVTGVW